MPTKKKCLCPKIFVVCHSFDELDENSVFIPIQVSESIRFASDTVSIPGKKTGIVPANRFSALGVVSGFGLFGDTHKTKKNVSDKE